MVSLTALDTVLESAVATGRIVGAVVLVSRAGQPLYQRAAGFADREAGIPIRDDAVFRLASVSKSIVTAAALRLVEQGALGLHDAVSRWLPECRPPCHDGSRSEISIHQLLTHTSGLSHPYLEPAGSPWHTAGISDGLDGLEVTIEENMRRLADLPLAFNPGTSWRYSLGIDVLGAVLCRVTGDSLPNIVAELVTQPLEMHHTRFTATPGQTLVTPYASSNDEPVRMHDDTALTLTESQIEVLRGPTVRAAQHWQKIDGIVRFSPSRAFSTRAFPSGGAGMIGTAHDILRFIEAIRKGGKPILRDETVQIMMRDHVGPNAGTQGPGWGFGYGWAVLPHKLAGTPQRPGTVQWGGAYGHSFFLDPAEQLSVVALTNTAFEGTSGHFPAAIRDAVYQG